MGHTGKKVFTQRKTKQTLETNRISEVGLPARTSNVYSVLYQVSTVNSRYHRDPVTEGQENTSIGRLTLPCVNEFQAPSSSSTLTTAYIVSCLMFIHSIKILNALEELQSA